MRLSIIIPQFNMAEMTQSCIDYITNNLKDLEYEIVVVDNGSRDIISDEYKKKVKYVRSENNLLFSGGCNLGAENSSYENLCFLNNDVFVFNGMKECVQFLLATDDFGIIGPKLVFRNGNIQHAGVQIIGDQINGGIFEHRYRGFSPSHPQANKTREYSCVTGACLFIRKEDFQKVGGFSTEFKNGYEDNDLCFKVKYQLGKKVIYYPHTFMYHLENQTPRDPSIIFNSENHIMFFNKWKDKIKIDKTLYDEMDMPK
jgi:GT2 family glycosyltransferase